MKLIIIYFFCFLASCSSADNNKEKISISYEKKVVSGQKLEISYNNNKEYKNLEVFLIDDKSNVIESYGIQKAIKLNGTYSIKRFLNNNINFYNKFFFRFEFTNKNNFIQYEYPVIIDKSVIVKSFCSTKDCNTNSGTVIQNTVNTIKVKTYKLSAVKIDYIINTPYENYKITHDFNSPVSNDYLSNLVFKEVPRNYSSYINNIIIKAYDLEGNVA